MIITDDNRIKLNDNLPFHYGPKLRDFIVFFRQAILQIIDNTDMLSDYYNVNIIKNEMIDFYGCDTTFDNKCIRSIRKKDLITEIKIILKMLEQYNFLNEINKKI